jgi:acyl-coenzyme A thioesterase PaaI-like protein
LQHGLEARDTMNLELPHSSNCLVCGRSNLHGLSLSLHVDTATGNVSTRFTPLPHHVGFEGVIHGGILATVLDEAMVWAATWSQKRFCLAAELTVRFRNAAQVGDELLCETKIDIARSKLVTTSGTLSRADGTLVAEATGKYIPLPPDRNLEFVKTLIDEPATSTALNALKNS